mgnify:CR=1 FL=1
MEIELKYLLTEAIAKDRVLEDKHLQEIQDQHQYISIKRNRTEQRQRDLFYRKAFSPSLYHGTSRLSRAEIAQSDAALVG